MSCAGPKVLYATERPEDGHKIGALLESLGYDAIADLAMLDGDVFELAVGIAGQRYRLTDRERELLLAMLRGHDRQQIQQTLGLGGATIKWHLHNIYSKLRVNGRLEALFLVLGLDDARWLRRPMANREALLVLARACERALGPGKLPEPTAKRLGEALASAKQLAGLDQDHDNDHDQLR